MSGRECYDEITIAPSLVIPQQSIGDADLVRLELPHFFLLLSALQTKGFDGILGYRLTYLVESLSHLCNAPSARLI